jgi:hypothetical protein
VPKSEKPQPVQKLLPASTEQRNEKLKNEEQKRTKNRETKRGKKTRTGAKNRGEREVSTATPFSRSSQLGKFSGDFELGFENSTEKRGDEA